MFYIYQLYLIINNKHEIFHTAYLEDVDNEDDIRDVIMERKHFNSPLNQFLKALMYDFEIKIIDVVNTNDGIRKIIKMYRDATDQHYSSYNVPSVKRYQQKHKERYLQYSREYSSNPDHFFINKYYRDKYKRLCGYN